MSSLMADVIDSAAALLRHNGQVEHFFSTCTNGGTVNAVRDKDDIACTACQINALAKAAEEARL